MSEQLTEDQLAYKATLPEGVIYIPTKAGGHNSVEDNEAFRRTSDETNARYRALVASLPKEES